MHSDRIPVAFSDDDGGTVAAYGGYFMVSDILRTGLGNDQHWPHEGRSEFWSLVRL